MRGAALIALLALSACSEGEAPQNKVATAAQQLEAGQWQLAGEIQSASARDEGPPVLKTEAGTKTNASGCVAEAERKRPPPALLTATEDACDYRDFYMSGGRINATMVCKRPGLSGELRHSVNGTYTAGEITAQVDTDTYLDGPGDMAFTTKVTGRRVGACTPSS